MLLPFCYVTVSFNETGSSGFSLETICLFLFEVVPGGGGGTPLYGLYRYVRPKGYGFSAVLVINRVSILAILPPFW